MRPCRRCEDACMPTGLCGLLRHVRCRTLWEGTHSTLAPSAPSAGSAAGSQMRLGRLLRARYLKLSTFFPCPLSTISPRPPRPDLHWRWCALNGVRCRQRLWPGHSSFTAGQPMPVRPQTVGETFEQGAKPHQHRKSASRACMSDYLNHIGSGPRTSL